MLAPAARQWIIQLTNSHLEFRHIHTGINVKEQDQGKSSAQLLLRIKNILLTFGPFGPGSPTGPCGPWGPWDETKNKGILMESSINQAALKHADILEVLTLSPGPPAGPSFPEVPCRKENRRVRKFSRRDENIWNVEKLCLKSINCPV